MNTDELHKLIELYFEGRTTLQQERNLREVLASMSAPYSPEVESALAVMGYASVMQPVAETRQIRNRRWMPAAAAAVSLLVVVAITWMLTGSRALHEDNICVAYVGGVKISSTEQVMEMMNAELSSISTAQDGLDNELLEQREAFSEIFNDL